MINLCLGETAGFWGKVFYSDKNVIHLARNLNVGFFFVLPPNLLQFKNTPEALIINIQGLGFNRSPNSTSVSNVFEFEVKGVKSWDILFSSKGVGK